MMIYSLLSISCIRKNREQRPEEEPLLEDEYDDNVGYPNVDEEVENNKPAQEEWTETPSPYLKPPCEDKDRGCGKYFEPNHYSKYFDVSTREVLTRIFKSFFPIIPGSIYKDGLHRPDMYGALWVMISLFICIPIFGNLNEYFHAWKDNDLANYHSNITKMWKIMACLIIYFFLVPFIVHNFFKCGPGEGSIDSR